MERLLDYFKPEVYQLDLKFDRTAESMNGTVVIIGGIINKEVIKLHALDLEIESVEYGSGEDFSICSFEYDGQILVIPVDAKMPAHLELRIKYHTQINQNLQGCYLSNFEWNGKKEKIVATQFESHYAREAFPCIDEPAAKASFSLAITVDDLEAGDVVLANTELAKQDGNRFIFAPTPRMSTYLLAWVIGKFQKVETTNQHGVKVATYAAINQNLRVCEFANEVAARALDYYDDKFGIKYPLAKLDQVALPDFEAGAMENWGLVTYRESCLLAEPDASVDTKQAVAITVTHELSHQWFGDLVTMAWWDDLWLNESFATIMEYYATDALYPELKAWQDFFTGDCVAALRRDSLRGVQAVKQDVNDPEEIATLFDGAIVYAKGARLILMLIHLMGEAKFLQGVHDYFEQHKYQNTVGDDLWNALQTYADFDVKDFMHAWISQSGYPALQATHNGEQSQWAQQRFLIDGTTDDTKWPLPEIKDDMSGHYLLDLSSAEFQQKLDDFDNLNLEQKLRLLIDRMMLAKARNVPTDSLVDILPKFVNEDAPTWSILLDIINDLKIFFPPETESEDMYREFLRRIIYTRVREVGVKSRPHDGSDEKRLRNLLAVVARFARDEEIMQQLAEQYEDNLLQIDAELRGNILTAKMYLDEAGLFPQLLQKYRTETDPEVRDDILGTLATVRTEPNIAKVIALLEQPDVVRPQDHYYLYVYLLRNSRARGQTLAWMYSHWDYIKKMCGDKNLEYYPRGAANCINTAAEAAQFDEFFEPLKSDPALRRTIEMAQVSIEARLGLIAAESAAVQQKVKTWLEQEHE